MPLEPKLLDAVTKTKGAIASAILVFSDLSAKLRAMGGSAEEENALADDLDAEATKLANAIVANP